MKDILVLGKVKALERAGAADLIVIDAPAAGHAVSFLTSARGLLDAVRVGPVRKQAADVVELLIDPARCQVMLVTVPEETPVTELVETAFAIEDRAGVALGPVVVNSCVDDLNGTAGARWTDASVRAEAERAGAPLRDEQVVALASAAGFRSDWYRRQQVQCARLAERLPLPQVRLPFLFTADIGPAEVDALADAFVASVGLIELPNAS
jgi:anion-transporting  ArsA/GET3 family ATPase